MLRSAIHASEHQIARIEKAIEELKKLPDNPRYLLEASIQLRFVPEDLHIPVDPTKVPLITILTGYIAGLRKDRDEMRQEFDNL